MTTITKKDIYALLRDFASTMDETWTRPADAVRDLEVEECGVIDWVDAWISERGVDVDEPPSTSMTDVTYDCPGQSTQHRRYAGAGSVYLRVIERERMGSDTFSTRSRADIVVCTHDDASLSVLIARTTNVAVEVPEHQRLKELRISEDEQVVLQEIEGPYRNEVPPRMQRAADRLEAMGLLETKNSVENRAPRRERTPLGVAILGWMQSSQTTEETS